MRLIDLLALSHVPRWSTVRHHRSQSVADHTFRVAAIYLDLCERLDLSPTTDDLVAIVEHDGPESRSGDISGEYKRELPYMVRVSLHDTDMRLCHWYTHQYTPLVKLADTIETLTFIILEGYGRHAVSVAEYLYPQVCKQAELADCPLTILEDIIHDITIEKDR